jgi:hypothetical protein
MTRAIRATASRSFSYQRGDDGPIRLVPWLWATNEEPGYSQFEATDVAAAANAWNSRDDAFVTSTEVSRSRVVLTPCGFSRGEALVSAI